MRIQILKLKETPMVLAQKRTQDLQTTNWDKAETSYVQLEGWKKMNCIRQKNDPMYVLSEVIQIPPLLEIWGSICKKILNDRVSESNI